MTDTNTQPNDDDDSPVYGYAQEETKRLGHPFVGTEQLLLGLLRDEAGAASRILIANGVTLADARREVESIIGRGSGSGAAQRPFTPRSARVIERAWKQVRELGDTSIRSEHILLAILQDDGVAVRVLDNLRIDRAKLRRDILANRG